MAANRPVVIIGGGIVGLCTAYFLLEEHGGDGRSITIVDNAPDLLMGASGAANGGMAWSAKESHAQQSLDWDQWSVQLQQSLAEKHDGYHRWDFRPMDTINLQHRSTEPSLSAAEVQQLRPVPSWLPNAEKFIGVRPAISWSSTQFHINPRRLGLFLIEHCKAAGVRILCNTSVSNVGVQNGRIEAVDLLSAKGTMSTQPCQHLVLTAGSWSFSILKQLFPDTKVKEPRQHVSYPHWLKVRDPAFKDEQSNEHCSQVFFQKISSFPLNLTNYSDGMIHVGRWATSDEDDRIDPEKTHDLPTDVTAIEVDPAAISELRKLAATALGVNPAESLEIIRQGRSAYHRYPDGRCIIASLDADMLWKDGRRQASGVYLAPSQMNGMACGPAMGKIVSELVVGRSPTFDMQQFGLFPAY